MKTIFFTLTLLLAGGIQSVSAQANNWNQDHIKATVAYVLKHGDHDKDVPDVMGIYLADGTAIVIEAVSPDTILIFLGSKLGGARMFTSEPRNFKGNTFTNVNADAVSSALKKVATGQLVKATPLLKDNHRLVPKLLALTDHLKNSPDGDLMKCRYDAATESRMCLYNGAVDGSIKIYYTKSDDSRFVFEFNPALPFNMGTQGGEPIDLALLEKILSFRGE